MVQILCILPLSINGQRGGGEGDPELTDGLGVSGTCKRRQKKIF